jgi:membrane-associated phospholipid phosphatase
MNAARQYLLLIPFILFSWTVLPAQAPVPQTSPVITRLSPTPAQSPIASSTPKDNFFKNVGHDQKRIWLSPFHLDRDDVKWLVPFALTATALIATDRKTSALVDRNGSLPAASRDVSFVGSAYATGGAVAGLYLIGRAAHDSRARETGVLAAEALFDTAVVTEILKLAAERTRPNNGSGHGLFFKHGSSFPSGHSASAWSVATVIAYKYKDHPFIKYGAFAAAALVSMSRYSGRNHFLGDIFIGSSIGFGIGRYVSHH